MNPLKKKRGELGLTQAEMAKKLGLAQSYISTLERMELIPESVALKLGQLEIKKEKKPLSSNSSRVTSIRLFRRIVELGGTLSGDERGAFFTLLTDENPDIRAEVLGIWQAIVSQNKSALSDRERSALLNSLKDSEPAVRLAGLGVWGEVAGNGTLSNVEVGELFVLLNDEDNSIRGMAYSLADILLEKGYRLSGGQRDALLKNVKDTSLGTFEKAP